MNKSHSRKSCRSPPCPSKALKRSLQMRIIRLAFGLSKLGTRTDHNETTALWFCFCSFDRPNANLMIRICRFRFKAWLGQGRDRRDFQEWCCAALRQKLRDTVPTGEDDIPAEEPHTQRKAGVKEDLRQQAARLRTEAYQI